MDQSLYWICYNTVSVFKKTFISLGRSGLSCGTWAHWLWCMGLLAQRQWDPRCPSRDQTRVPRSAWCIPNRWTTRKVPVSVFNNKARRNGKGESKKGKGKKGEESDSKWTDSKEKKGKFVLVKDRLYRSKECPGGTEDPVTNHCLGWWRHWVFALGWHSSRVRMPPTVVLTSLCQCLSACVNWRWHLSWEGWLFDLTVCRYRRPCLQQIARQASHLMKTAWTSGLPTNSTPSLEKEISKIPLQTLVWTLN